MITRGIAISILLGLSLVSCDDSSLSSQERPSTSKEEISLGKRGDYEKIDLDTLAQSDSQEANLVGDDPETIVLEQFGFSQLRESQEQKVTVQYPQDNQAIVILTQTGLLDDSVAGIRYRVELVSNQETWRVVWVGRQYKCQPGRGHQDWSTQLCA